jgi:hypothetical protein
MPRLVHRLPKYSLHKASRQARVRYAGKVTYLSKHGSQESHEAYAEFIASLPKPGAQPKLAPMVPGVTPLVGEIVYGVPVYRPKGRNYVLRPRILWRDRVWCPRMQAQGAELRIVSLDTVVPPDTPDTRL